MTDEAKLDEFFERIASWERLGKVTSRRGTTFYALPVDENGVQTGHLWFQRLFPALTEDELGEMEADFGLTLPEVFRQFYLRACGVNLFNSSFALYGYINRRTSDLSIGLGLYNLGELQAPYMHWDGKPSFYFFGNSTRYYNTLNYLCLDRDDGRIYLTAHRYTCQPIASWDSLPDMLLSEYERLESLFTVGGVQIAQRPSLDQAYRDEGEARFVQFFKDARKAKRKAKAN